MASAAFELHLTVNPDGHLRPQPHIDTGDIHFAARVQDFEAAERHLIRMGYREDATEWDPKRLVFRRNGPAPYLQVYLLDPDNHLIELNSAMPKVLSR